MKCEVGLSLKLSRDEAELARRCLNELLHVGVAHGAARREATRASNELQEALAQAVVEPELTSDAWLMIRGFLQDRYDRLPDASTRRVADRLLRKLEPRSSVKVGV